MEILYALVLGIVEGLTEFLPVSSTGHLILTSVVLGLKIDDFWRDFIIIIQLGSILAVIFVFFRTLTQSLQIYLKLAVGFVPTGIIGLIASGFVKDLFNAYIVVAMLIFGGIVFIVIEKAHKNKAYKIHHLSEVGFRQAFCIGVIQSLAMIPGTSRSGASIVGGLLLGLNRKVATEWSFLLALPTMIAATGYDIYKHPEIITQPSSLGILSIGFIAAFIVAFFVIRLFLAFISRFDFVPFGVYRIIIGLVFLALLLNGIISLDAV